MWEKRPMETLFGFTAAQIAEATGTTEDDVSPQLADLLRAGALSAELVLTPKPVVVFRPADLADPREDDVSLIARVSNWFVAQWIENPTEPAKGYTLQEVREGIEREGENFDRFGMWAALQTLAGTGLLERHASNPGSSTIFSLALGAMKALPAADVKQLTAGA